MPKSKPQTKLVSFRVPVADWQTLTVKLAKLAKGKPLGSTKCWRGNYHVDKILKYIVDNKLNAGYFHAHRCV